jgi:uncharacterized protein YciI
MLQSIERSGMPAVPYFMVLLLPGSNHASAQKYLAAHVEFIEKMAGGNVVLLAGDFDAPIEGAEVGYLLRTASQTEAEAWVAKDPLVKNAVYKPRVVAWKLFGIIRGAIDPGTERNMTRAANSGPPKPERIPVA